MWIQSYFYKSANFVLISTNHAINGATFSITETKLHVPLVNLSTEDNGKLLHKLDSKRTIS